MYVYTVEEILVKAHNLEQPFKHVRQRLNI